MSDGYNIFIPPKDNEEEGLITCFVSGELFHESEMIEVPLSGETQNHMIHKSMINLYVEMNYKFLTPEEKRDFKKELESLAEKLK